MDFIKQLPPSRGYTDILVIVDQLTKQAIFVPTYNSINAQTLADLSILHVFSKHGILLYVMSDWGPKFISSFSRSLARTLQMKLYFISGYYSEANSQSERMNQTLKQYLHMYCNYQQDNWSKLLLLAKLAFNKTTFASTGVSLFFANKGYHPCLQFQPIADLPLVAARTYSNNLDTILANLKQTLVDSQAHCQTYADAHKSTPLQN